ncbi:NAD(P)H-quinone oxidoreductase [Pistricoccus aurantiacus]|uniref:NAD(P)H-quinone oxidoreductase n=1 Tax=Pistricoccus aurantiacus TaxID=1883414 RepID=UPI003639B077
MHAIILNDQALEWREQPSLGDPGPGKLKIHVAWAGVNHADLGQRAGNYPPPPGESDIMGLEVSGTVSQVGSNVERFRVGDRVCALLAGGGYAEEVIVSERQVLPVPEGITLRDAAAIPEVFATAWLNLFMKGGLSSGERVLVHAGASGVGTAAIQLCNAFEYSCFATVGSDAKIDFCMKLGASTGWNRHQGSFVEAVKAFGGADLILDPVGGSYLGDNQRVLNADGRLIIIGLLGGRSAELDLGRLLMKRQRIVGSTLRSQSSTAKGAILDALYEHAWPRFESGEIIPLIDRTWPIRQAEDAMQYLEDNDGIGKVLLCIDDELND